MLSSLERVVDGVRESHSLAPSSLVAPAISCFSVISCLDEGTVHLFGREPLFPVSPLCKGKCHTGRKFLKQSQRDIATDIGVCPDIEAAHRWQRPSLHIHEFYGGVIRCREVPGMHGVLVSG